MTKQEVETGEIRDQCCAEAEQSDDVCTADADGDQRQEQDNG